MLGMGYSVEESQAWRGANTRGHSQKMTRGEPGGAPKSEEGPRAQGSIRQGKAARPAGHKCPHFIPTHYATHSKLWPEETYYSDFPLEKMPKLC